MVRIPDPHDVVRSEPQDAGSLECARGPDAQGCTHRIRTKESTMTAPDITQNRTELAQRASNGIDVRLLWNQADDTVADGEL